MKQQVVATRMELLHIKRRLALAVRGHKLLKDKLDGLTQKFLETIKDYQKFRKQSEENLQKVYESSIAAQAGSFDLDLSILENFPLYNLKVEEKKQNIMGVKIPQYFVDFEKSKDSMGLGTSLSIREATKAASDFLPDLIKLAEMDKKVEVLGEAIIDLRRRVNSLEYVLIPELREQGKYIKVKLAELELGAQVRLMKVKDIIRK